MILEIISNSTIQTIIELAVAAFVIPYLRKLAEKYNIEISGAKKIIIRKFIQDLVQAEEEAHNAVVKNIASEAKSIAVKSMSSVALGVLADVNIDSTTIAEPVLGSIKVIAPLINGEAKLENVKKAVVEKYPEYVSKEKELTTLIKSVIYETPGIGASNGKIGL